MTVIKKNKNVLEDVEKREPLFIGDGKVNWCNHNRKQYGDFSKKSIIELPYYQAIPLLGIYLKKMKTLT